MLTLSPGIRPRLATDRSRRGRPYSLRRWSFQRRCGINSSLGPTDCTLHSIATPVRLWVALVI